MRRVAMLPDVDSLPRAEAQTPVEEWDREMRLREGCLDVRGHVVRAFVVVGIAAALRHEAGEEVVQIGEHGRIRVLLNGQTRRCVPDEDVHQSQPMAGRGDGAFDLVRDIGQSLTVGGDNDGFVHGSLGLFAAGSRS